MVTAAGLALPPHRRGGDPPRPAGPRARRGGPAGEQERRRFASRPESWRPAASPAVAPGNPMERGLRNAIVFNASKGEAFTLASSYKALRKRLRGNWKIQR